MADTHRDWPAPTEDEPDFIIRDPLRYGILARCAAIPMAGASAAADLIHQHHIAVAANLQLGVVLQRWRTSRMGTGQ